MVSVARVASATAKRLLPVLTLGVVLAGALAFPAPSQAAPEPITPDEVIALAQSGVGYSYWWGNGCWRTDGTQLGACAGNCPDCTHSGRYGSDCSGYVAKVWQVPGPIEVSSCAHPYSTWHFTCTDTWWTPIDRAEIRRGDALTYRSACDGSGSGHIVLYEEGDPWGWPTVYEARGCSTGTVHGARELSGAYIAIRRDDIAPPCVPAREVCNGFDDDCDEAVDEGGVCALEREVALMASLHAPAGTTDVDGDGRADLCGRYIAGYRCHLGGGGGFSGTVESGQLRDADGWDDPLNYSTIRLGDVDGDGRADLCARGDHGVFCWRSTGDAFAPNWYGFIDSLSDWLGWGRDAYSSTLRLADVDGDGRDDVCARYGDGFRCHRSLGMSAGGGFAAAGAAAPLTDAAGWDDPVRYGSIRLGDIDGDGAADVCGRDEPGVFCWRGSSDGFGARVLGPAWSDAMYWDRHEYYSTLRLADVDGDGRDDICARGSLGFRCHRSQGATFGGEGDLLALSDRAGWSDISNYSTIRMGDVDGDGRDDVCARADAGMFCWRSTESSDGAQGFDEMLTGPALSDADGWNVPARYLTIRLADVDGDGRADICARGAERFRCWLSDGAGFPTEITGPAWGDTVGWGDEPYWSTIRLAGPQETSGPPCEPETERCNGRDDDCDGEVDEGFEVGSSCGVGSGDCETVGVWACRSDGERMCDAPPAEVGRACEDGDPCTLGDTCDADGLCRAGAVDHCDDGNPCTDDSCQAGWGCAHAPNRNSCDDGNPATVGDRCLGGHCLGTTQTSCDDKNPCTDDIREGGRCVHEPAEGLCDDGDPCTGDDHCSGGVCVARLAAPCDDGNPCTDDACLPGVGCVHEPNTATCSDGDICTSGDRCRGGSCVAGAPLLCDDDNLCTDDACDPWLGCRNTHNALTCDDGDPCTAGDHCVRGVCQGGRPYDCDDDNRCTDDRCTPTGCAHRFHTDACDDGDPCTVGERCTLGVCCGGAPLDCDDGDPCTDDGCRPGLGCAHAFNDEPCDDGDPCTFQDHCDHGACGGAALDCDDGDPCTVVACDDGACVQLFEREGCCSSANDCAPGHRCDGELHWCVPVACEPCGDDTDCGDGGPDSGRCFQLGSGAYCLTSCAADGDCPEGFSCAADAGACVPDAGDCHCEPDVERACVGGDLVWLDGCGRPGDVAEGCGERGCLAGGCCPPGTHREGDACVLDPPPGGPDAGPDGGPDAGSDVGAPDVAVPGDTAPDGDEPDATDTAADASAVDDAVADTGGDVSVTGADDAATRPDQTKPDGDDEEPRPDAWHVPPLDSGSGDPVAPNPTTAGQGCAAGGAAPDVPWFFLLLTVGLAAAVTRRRRARPTHA